MLVDYHTHTNNSFDSQALMAETCEEAIKKGIKQICFTEHFTLNPRVPTYGHLDWGKFNEEIDQCKRKFHNTSLTILKGIEICEPYNNLDEYATLFKNQQMDFILGSIHNVNHVGLLKILASHTKTDSYTLYFQEMLMMVQKSDIDCLSHFDLIKRYSNEPFSIDDFELFYPIIRSILSTAIERDIGIEINTSTIDKLNEPMPARNILSLYKELGGEILTIGSDSHQSDFIGKGTNVAYQLAKDCGFTKVSTFTNRQVEFVSICG
jgi:histidinol-phosphatase (PHP family)